MKAFCSGVAAAIALALASCVHANILVNGGLETLLSPTMPDDLVYASPTLNPGALPGWTIAKGSIDIVPASYFSSSQGNFSVDLVGTPGIGGISQTFATTPDVSYVLTFDMAVNPDTWTFDERGTVKRLLVSALGADGSSLLSTQLYSGSDGTRTRSNMEYLPEIFSFTADGASTTLRLEALSPLNLIGLMTEDNIYTGPVIDNLDLEIGGGAPSPEPTTLAMFGLGGLALLRRRRAV